MSKVINNSKINIAQELMLLRSAVIGLISKDPEGEYRPEFVEKVLRATKEKTRHTFTTKEKFLKQIS